MAQNSQATPSNVVHLLAGLCTGCGTAIVLQPLDLLKTRVQQSRASTLTGVLDSLRGQHGSWRSLWRGTVPSVLRTGVGSALYFTQLNAIRSAWARRKSRTIAPEVGGEHRQASSSSLVRLSNTANLLSGATARVTAGMLVMPMTVLKVRYESDLYKYRSLWGAAKDILKTEGLRGFFAGFGATASRDAPYAGLYVLFYEQCKRHLGDWQRSRSVTDQPMSAGVSTSINFTSGVVAAGLATALTNPFDAIKTRIQLMPHRYHNVFRASRLMWQEGGIRGFFDGLGLRMARKAISSALVWMMYEEVIRQVDIASGDRHTRQLRLATAR